MTVEDLYQFRALVAEYEALKKEIETLYDAYRSPFNFSGAFSTTPGNPTAEAAYRIESEVKKLNEQKQKIFKMLTEINDWLLTIEDPEISAIIRDHFISGLTWRETAARVYKPGTAGDVARMRFKRWAIKLEN